MEIDKINCGTLFSLFCQIYDAFCGTIQDTDVLDIGFLVMTPPGTRDKGIICDMKFTTTLGDISKLYVHIKYDLA